MTAEPDPVVRIVGGLVDGHRLDVRCAGGVITHVDREVPPGGHAVQADGGEVIPALHDHHIHLLALAAAASSVDVSPATVRDGGGMARALRDAPGDGWLRAVGYHESVAGDLDRHGLDAFIADRPLRVQHRSGQRWILNSLACRLTQISTAAPTGSIERGADGEITGRVTGDDQLLRDRIPPLPLDLHAVGLRLAGYGVAAVTDLTPTTDPAELKLLTRHCLHPAFPLYVTVTGAPQLAQDEGGLAVGPAKIVIGDYDLPDLEEVIAAIGTARRAGRPVAVHSVTAVSAAIAIAAWGAAGVIPGDRLEHGAVLPIGAVQRLAELGVTVVTQPNFVHERGDEYLTDIPHDRDELWRCASLAAAGIPIAGGTDAPFGHPDPWRAIAAAIDRTTRNGRPLGPDERLHPRAALDLFLGPADRPGGPPRRVAQGQPAMLCVLDRPLARVLDDPNSDHVVATIGRTAALRH